MFYQRLIFLEAWSGLIFFPVCCFDVTWQISFRFYGALWSLQMWAPLKMAIYLNSCSSSGIMLCLWVIHIYDTDSIKEGIINFMEWTSYWEIIYVLKWTSDVNDKCVCLANNLSRSRVQWVNVCERERRYRETDWLNKMSIYRADCGVTPWELWSRQRECALAQLHLRSTPANLRSYIPWWTCTCTKTSALSKMEKQERHFATDRTLTTTKLNLPPFNVLSHPSLPFCWLSQMSPLLRSVCQVSVSQSGLTGDGGGPRVVVMCLGRRITEFPRFIRAEMLSFTDALDTLELTYFVFWGHCGIVQLIFILFHLVMPLIF